MSYTWEVLCKGQRVSVTALHGETGLGIRIEGWRAQQGMSYEWKVSPARGLHFKTTRGQKLEHRRTPLTCFPALYWANLMDRAGMDPLETEIEMSLLLQCFSEVVALIEQPVEKGAYGQRQWESRLRGWATRSRAAS